MITPVVRKANRKTVADISPELENLAERVRSGKLNPSEARGGPQPFRILVVFGVNYFIPIINPPQATKIGVGKVGESANGKEFCTITLVFDHRVTDGARAAQPLQKIKGCIGNLHLPQMS